MKRILSILVISIIFCCILGAQTIVNNGKPIAEIFTDFHYNINDSSKTSGFGLNRAYLGYSFEPGRNFTTTLVINVGSPEDLAYGSTPKRYAYFREASVAYTREKLTLSFGMVSTHYADFQQGFWGKRYLGPEYQALYGYGSVADLGVVVDYKFNDIVKADFSLLNGEGYTNIQVDNSLKTAVGITITTPHNVAVRLYSDISRPFGVWQSTAIAFGGIKNELFSIGVEASYKTNLDLIKGHDVWGLSATGAIFISTKSELFVRTDYTSSVIIPFDVLPWDCNKDATYIIGGLQHTINSNLKMALNYRLTDPHTPGRQTTNAIYLNARFKF
jgi:hypothetical protein